MDPRTTDILDRINRSVEKLARPVTIMEVCGTHTMAVFRHGLKSLLPEQVRLISGPGCPVCVTSQGFIDAVVGLAGRPGVMTATYGDMVRVPGRSGSLERARAAGANVRTVLSAMDAVGWARENPDSTVAFVAVGFETTAPGTAAAVLAAEQAGLANFVVLPAHKYVVPAMRALLDANQVNIDGFLCPGHVSVIIGSGAYEPIARDYSRPCVVAGFEPGQVLAGLAAALEQLAAGRAEVENVYGAAVSSTGNQHARRLMERVFTPADAAWRGLGVIADSGMVLRPAFGRFDGFARFGVVEAGESETTGCRCGEVVRGLVEPTDCPLFGRACTPVDPVGPCMVSSEGACAAWHKYGGRNSRSGNRQRAM